MEQDLLQRLRDLRKRRGTYRSAERASRELVRLRSLLPAGSLEREIFERAEMLGDSYKSIADHLNVSERHLYRVRRRMLEMIDAGESSLQAQLRPSHLSRVDLIATLIKYGHADRAESAVRRLTTAELGARERVELASFEVIAACERGNREAVDDRLQRLNALVARCDVSLRSVAERRLALTQAYVVYYEGSYEAALARVEAALAPWMERGPAAVEPSERRPLARDVTLLGIMHQEGGSPQRAIEVLTFAEQLLRLGGGDAVNPELAMIFVHRGFARAALPEGLEGAKEDAARAATLANGLPYEEVWARLLSAIVNEFAGEPASALDEARRALDLGRAVLGGDPLARTHFLTSRVEIFAGDLDETIENLQEARPLVPADSLMGTISHLAEARVWAARGEPRLTYEAANRAIAGFESRNTATHYLGAAYMRRAMAGHALRRDVREDAEHAVALLGRGGWIPDLRRALELSARLTGNPRHQEAARTLHV